MEPFKCLETMGFGPWYASQLDPALSAHRLARVVSVAKNSLLISDGTGECRAELAGKLLYGCDSATELPTTGDWVYVDYYDGDSHAIVHQVLSRKTLLKRKNSGKAIDIQLIAANVDHAFVVQSVDANFNLRRLERYLLMVNEGGAEAIILLSKADLATPTQLQEAVDSVTSIAPDSAVLPISVHSGLNAEQLKQILIDGHTYCMLGSSGVGKTTLLNALLGRDEYATQAVDGDSKGRHTTTSRELIKLPGGALLIDTPGMRELGSISADAGLDQSFADIAELANQCRFNDCEHDREKGCAVQAAILAQTLDPARFRNYQKIQRESAFNQMSYQQKRGRDKRFGKEIKAALKIKGDRR